MQGETNIAAPAAGNPFSSDFSESKAAEEFRGAARDAGFTECPDVTPNAPIVRFKRAGKGSSKDCWAILHVVDGLAWGGFGDWGGAAQGWTSKGSRPQNKAERDAMDARIKAVREQQEVAQEAEYAAAAERAQKLWDAATPVDGDNHPYLQRKGVEAHGLKVGEWEFIDGETGDIRKVPGTLMVPIYRKVNGKGTICSIEGILPDGGKYGFKGGRKAGGYHVIGTPKTIDDRMVFLIAEGYSTGASIHESTKHCVVLAFTASNLEAVARQIRAGQPDATIMLCADDDFTNDANVGVETAGKAARAVAGHVVKPEFSELEGKATNDWNDLAGREGKGIVEAQIKTAVAGAVRRDSKAAASVTLLVDGAQAKVAAVLAREPGSDDYLGDDDDASVAPSAPAPIMTVEDMKDMFAKCQAVEDLDVAAGKIREQNISDADLAIVVPQFQNTFKLLSDGRSVSVADARRALRLLENDAERAVVAELNAQHAVVLAGDKAVVLRESPRDTGEPGFEVRLLSESAFRTFYRNRTVDILIERDGETRKKTVPIADWWLKSADRRTYEGITFAPDCAAHPDYYNLWHGYAVEPRAGSLFSNAMKCRRLLSHIKMNVCRGNREHFRYLLAWAADMLQDPGKKKGVALVLRGNKGSGKSKVAEVFASLLGQHSIKIAQMKHLVGNFNRHLANKLLVVAEESFWAGDRADDGPLKDMITSSTLTLEAKGIDAIEMKSFARIMMITNNNWAVPATSDERRYFVLDVGNDRREDHAYFAAIDKQLDDNDQEGRRALLAFLLAFDLSTVNLRKVPETAALREQRGLSLEPHDQFIFDGLLNKEIAGTSWGLLTEIPKSQVHDAYIDAGKKRSKSHLLPDSELTKKLKRFGIIPTRPRVDGDRVQSYKFPEWDVCVKTFESVTGVDVAALFEKEGGTEGVAF